MTDGELKKRIHATRKYRGGYMAMKRIAPIIDEAKKDLANRLDGLEYPEQGLDAYGAWVDDWFGDST